MKPIGPRSRTSEAIAPIRLAAALAVIAVIAPIPSAGADVGSFVLPGVDAGRIELTLGHWCRYVVVDEAAGVVDSSLVYVAVLGRESVAGDDAYWLEVETGPAGSSRDDRDVTKVLISGKIKGYAYGDSLYRYVHKLYIKKGGEPPELCDPADLRRLTLRNETPESQWVRRSGVTVATALGPIDCDEKELVVEDSREIPTGRVTLIRHNVDRYRVWSSREIPVFGLVQCVIDRSHESRTVPAVPGIPDAGVRRSRTTALVVEFGDNARPILTVP